jgi:hypothetical protein
MKIPSEMLPKARIFHHMNEVLAVLSKFYIFKPFRSSNQPSQL